MHAIRLFSLTDCGKSAVSTQGQPGVVPTFPLGHSGAATGASHDLLVYVLLRSLAPGFCDSVLSGRWRPAGAKGLPSKALACRRRGRQLEVILCRSKVPARVTLFAKHKSRHVDGVSSFSISRVHTIVYNFCRPSTSTITWGDLRASSFRFV